MREHTDVNAWTTGYVESVDILVSVRPSIFKKNDRQDVGMTRAKIPRDDGNISLKRWSQSQNYDQIAFIGHRGEENMSGRRRTDGLAWIMIGEA